MVKDESIISHTSKITRHSQKTKRKVKIGKGKKSLGSNSLTFNKFDFFVIEYMMEVFGDPITLYYFLLISIQLIIFPLNYQNFTILIFPFLLLFVFLLNYADHARAKQINERENSLPVIQVERESLSERTSNNGSTFPGVLILIK